MARLAAHAQFAHTLYTSEAGSLCSSTKSGATICALRDWRDWRVGRSSKLEKKLGYACLCVRNERSSIVHCSRVAAAATEALPWSVEDLEQRFGQAGVKFVDAAGYRIVEMRLNEGSSARIVLQSALVSSYKSRMWHGGLEELLHTAVVPGVDESQRPTMVGGVGIRVWEADAGCEESNLAATKCWDVENVRSNPAQFVQVTLSTTPKGHAADAILQFKYVFTLTTASLSCALITTNIGDSAVSIHGSLQTSVEVNFVDGAYALGLQGCKYLSMPPNSSPGAMELNTEKATRTDEGLFSKWRWFSGVEGDKKRNDFSVRTDNEMIVEEEEMVRMKGGFDRLYTGASDCVSLLDRGKRRTVNFHNTGFGDIRLSNPGVESGLEDWDSFVCIELARSIQPVYLQPGQEWRAAQHLENPSK